MRVLLDTQLIYWWLTESPRLPASLQTILREESAGQIFVSRVSQWELSIKIASGKLKMDLREFSAQVEPDGFQWLEIKSAHVLVVATLPSFPDHKDPFDRLLVAQSLTEPLILLTTDDKLKRYGSTIRVVA